MILSIITINRNNFQGLAKTMESVLTQTFVDYEYIVVDGASTDKSVDVIREFEKLSNGKLKWLTESDTGVYNAMNKGIKLAGGEYLLFLNSGDYLINSKVLEQLFNCHPKADILCARCNVSENEKVVWTSNPPEIITFGTLYQQGLAHQSTLIKRELLINLSYYREDFRYNSDIDFWYRSIILNGASTEKIDVILSDYNLDGISSKENQTEQYQSELKQILSQSNFDKFIPDYDSWIAERKKMEIWYWASNQRFLSGLVESIHTFSICFVKFRKYFRNRVSK